MVCISPYPPLLVYYQECIGDILPGAIDDTVVAYQLDSVMSQSKFSDIPIFTLGKLVSLPLYLLYGRRWFDLIYFPL